ncbi:MAG: lytic murein transglycosylase [bacterium]
MIHRRYFNFSKFLSRLFRAGIFVSSLFLFLNINFVSHLIPFSIHNLQSTIYVSAQVTGSDVAAKKAQLQAQLADLEAQIATQEAILKDQQGKSESLSRDIKILDAQIAKAKLDIKARTISIENLTDSIGDKQVTITKLTTKLGKEKESLAQLLRKTNEIDSYSTVEVVLSNENLSSFFQDLDSFDSIKNELNKSFEVITDTKVKTEDEKTQLEDKRDEETKLKNLQILEQKRIQQQEAEKAAILKASKGIESLYQNVLKQQTLSAAQIRAQLFSLQGSAAIPFEKALDYANFASQKTGVRPAVILGIIAEESNLGQNVGTGNWLVDMKAPRDTEPFKAITAALGVNPDTVPVSKKPWYGYGGAMGPAQFIPSTWVLYAGYVKNSDGSWSYNSSKDRIRSLTGSGLPSNPWDARDAFMACGILMKENGAAARTYGAERLAALRYLAGWGNASKSAYAFYGDDVMALANKYQKMIDILSGK